MAQGLTQDFDFRQSLEALPLVAILRGLVPEEAPALGGVLVDCGFRAIEVPLNSPRPLDSIAALARACGDRALIGAGTVRDPGEVARVAAAGGRLIVSPHADPAVIGEARRLGLVSIPGVATPTEGFVALAAGAHALKLFPAEAIPPAVVKAWRAVFPAEAWLLPVGGITPDSMAAYLVAGADGFGLGSALFRPGMSAAALHANAERFAAAFAAARAALRLGH